MTVYSVNLGIGWASSGVEYAQKYRNESFEKLHIPAKFIFSDLILGNNIEDLTKNMGYDDDQIIWLYNFFTDVKIAPSTYKLERIVQDLNLRKRSVASVNRTGSKEMTYRLPDENLSIAVRLNNLREQTIDQVTYFDKDQMSKREFYSYTKYATEYYEGNGSNKVTFREFYNEDGSVAYVQHLDDNSELFEFPDKNILMTKNDLYCEMVKKLNLQKDDVIIMDREDENDDLSNGQIFFEEHKPAKLIVIVHADHYDVHYTDDQNILWNNFYEFQFTHNDDVDSFVCATPKQTELLREQEKKYYNNDARVDCIPVGCVKTLVKSDKKRKPYSLITASRLASEKHVDWIVRAVIAAKKEIPELNLDIYGRGGMGTRLEEIIRENNAESYIRLMGQRDLDDVYVNYEGYIAASTSEGFGLSLLEAVSSGCAMIGFNVPYGNPTFIDDGKNGYLLPYDEDWDVREKINKLTEAIVKMFKSSDVPAFNQRSYEIAEPYLLDNVAQEWKKLLEDLKDD